MKRLYSYYKDDFALIYESYKAFVSNAINERFTDYLQMINDEQDEKALKKLKVVEVRLLRDLVS